MTRQQIHLVNDHLSTRILDRCSFTEYEQALIEQLCIDSIYTVKDDFDKGLNEQLWTVENMELAEHDPFGVLVKSSPDDIGASIPGESLLRSRQANFYPNRRATKQGRIQQPGESTRTETE